MVPMDAILIEQVLINLMENAALHGVTATEIRLRLRRDGDRAVFEVADNGRGISREAMGHLFDGCSTHVGDEPESDQKRNMGDNATVVVHINRLREKIEKDPANPRHIQTVWGAGYRFRA